jgi:hypothetical protein
MTTADLRPAEYNIHEVAGADLSLVITCYEDDGTTPLDVSTYTFAADVLRAGAVVDSFTPVVSGVNDNILTLTLTDTETAAIGTGRGLEWALKVTVGTVTDWWYAGEFRLYQAGTPRDRASSNELTAVVGGSITALLTVGVPAADTAANVPIADAGTYFTGTDVEAALQEVGADLAGLPAQYGSFISAAAYGAVGDDSTDNTTALTNALAAAKAAARPLYIPAGTYRYSGDILSIDWHAGAIIGDGARSSILKQTSTSANGVIITPLTPSNVIYNARIERVSIVGPGSGSGVGVDLTPQGDGNGPKNGVLLNDVMITDFGSHGLHTRNTDYLKMIGVKIEANGGDGWYADIGTNATSAIGCAFNTARTSPAFARPAGKASVRAVDMDGATFIGCEINQAEYGVIVTAGTTLAVNFIGCRFEAITQRYVQIGEGVATYPTTIGFRNCAFLGFDSGDLNPLITVNGATVVTFDNCWAGGTPAGGTFVKSLMNSANSKVYMTHCFHAGGGRYIFEDDIGTKYEAEQIHFDSTYESFYSNEQTINGGAGFAVASGSSTAIRVRQTADATNRARFEIKAGGSLNWGAPPSTTDVTLQRNAADRLDMGAGDSFRVDGTWNGGRLLLGSYHLWVDATGDLRIKSSAPTSDTDGTVVGTQS